MYKPNNDYTFQKEYNGEKVTMRLCVNDMTYKIVYKGQCLQAGFFGDNPKKLESIVKSFINKK